MTNCPACGEAVAEVSKFCSNCGKPVAPYTAITVARGPGYHEAAGRFRSPIARRRQFVWTGTFFLLSIGLLSLGYRSYLTKVTNEHFSRNVQCAKLAQDFAKGRTSDEAEPVVTSAFYSSKRNSCVAAVERRLEQRFVVQAADPVTGEILWVEGCSMPDECNGNLVLAIRLRARGALDKWADSPLDHPTPH
jgi:zinc-ribbon domain